MATSSPNLIQQFYEKIDELVAPYFQEYKPYLKCQKGCTECCTDETGFQIRRIEADEILRAFQALPKQEQVLIQNNLKQAEANNNLEKMPCPMLIDNACSIYAHRPTICRVFGLLIDLRSQKGCCKLNFNDVPKDVTLNTVGLDPVYDLLNELNEAIDPTDERKKISQWLNQLLD